MGHAELGAVGSDEPAIGDRLQKAISGADRGTARAKQKLEAAVHRYRTEGHKNPGQLKVVREETALGLKEAKDLVDGAPKPVKQGVSKEEAERVKKKIEDAGGTAELK